MVKRKKKRGRPKKYRKIGDRYWACYRPGRRNLYQLQEITNKYGGATTLSPWMELGETRTFISGWRSSGGKRKLPLFKRRR